MNIRMVAQLAKVSTATVSRTMNGSAHVNPETAERVRRAIKELNFYPNTIARSLGSGRSGLFGLIISDITNPFFPALVKAFEDLALTHGQEVLIANTNYDPKRMQDCVTRFLQRKVEGVAIMTSEMDEHALAGFYRKSIPLVFLDIEHSGPQVRCVKVDYAAGMELAFDHVWDLGHRKIGFLAGPQTLKSAALRYGAFLQISKRLKHARHAHFVQEANHRVEGGRDAMMRVLGGGERPTAILTSNDLTAIGAMSAIEDAGLRVPDDISIVGFDNIPFSAYSRPSLTTIALPGLEIARAAFAALLDSKETSGRRRRARLNPQVVVPTLIQRNSTGPPKNVRHLP